MIDITTFCFIFCNNFNKSCAFVGFNSAARIAVYCFKTSKTWLIYIPWYFGHRWLSQDISTFCSFCHLPFVNHYITVLHSEYIYFNFYTENLNAEALFVKALYSGYWWRSNIKVNMSCLGFKLWSNRKITFKPIYPWNQNVSPCIKRSRSHFTMLERAPLF